MRYRKLDANGDYSFGHGQADFYIDVPLAVAQSVETRLALWVGDWFLDVNDGMAWRTDVLGVRTQGTRDATVRERVLSTFGVATLVSYASQTDSTTRTFSVQMLITTIFSNEPTKLSVSIAPPVATRILTDGHGNAITDGFGNPIELPT